MFHGAEAEAIDAVLTDIQFEPSGSFSISLWYKLNVFELNSKFGNILIGDRGEDGAGFQVRQYANAADWPEISDLNGGWLCFTTRGVGSDLSFDPRQGPDATEIRYEEDMPYMAAIYPAGFVHLVVVLDVENGKKQIWLDQELVVDAYITDPDEYFPAYSGDLVMIGARNDASASSTPEHSFNGVIDEVRIYEKALALTDIQEIYAATVNTGVNDVRGNIQDLVVSQTNGNINCALELKIGGEIQTSLYDMSGRLVNETTLSVTAGENTFEIGAADFAKGAYIVKVSYQGINLAKKIVLR